ncbi:MAG: Fic family protein [Candidatus Shapirobacteria bacterium]|nr:Fic family protein [Candidatus Shapirobacteria bacterium]MDD4383231.1 Fic family protein [Candidatus Shapirobacteria bacterium]
MNNLNGRQLRILEILKPKQPIGPKEILEKLNQKVSIVTISRDLSELVDLKYLYRNGNGPATQYFLLEKALFFRPIDYKKYFEIETDKRDIVENFNMEIFTQLSKLSIFTPKEQTQLETLDLKFRKNYSQLSPTIIKKEIERVTIELSWKSSVIEGNTYSLLETERLIKEGTETKGKKKEEAIMLLNHKKALDFVFENKKLFKMINRSKIEQLHKIITQDLGITNNLRKTLVGITGTKFKPLDNQFQIIEAIDKFCDLINNTQNIFTKSLFSIILLSYIQPFEDGNKRTSRILGNAILIADNSFPLPLRSVDENLYKEATLLFYEQNNLNLFKQMFLDQCNFSVENYFRI